MTSRRRLLRVACLIALVAGCSRSRPARRVDVPAGDAVWLADGLAAMEPDVEPELARGGFTTVFLPAARLSREQAVWTAHEVQPPPRPFTRTAVFLVIESDPPGPSDLGTTDRARAWAESLWLAVQTALRDRARFGRVAGVHLDVAFDPADPAPFAVAVSSLRSRLSTGMPLTVSLRSVPVEKDAEKWRALAAAADGFVAFVFGPRGGAAPAATDRLGKPWWAGYTPAAVGSWTDGGEERGPLPEDVLARLSDDPRVDFIEKISLKEESDSSFLARPRAAIALGARTLPAGSRIEFRQPSLADMIDRMGRDLAGRRNVRGRAVLLSGGSDSERIFTLAALVGILSGGALEPDLRVSIETGGARGIQVSAENASPNASVVSRTANWAEVDLPGGGVRDVQSGGFDRYEVFGRDGQPSLLGRATRVRFYETLVGPHEKIAPARIILRRTPPDCCALRIHVLAASGKEVVK